MKLIKVGAGVLNQTPMAWEQNRANILAAIAEAKRQHVSLLCLPELAITGYGCEDEFHAPGLQAMARRILDEVREATAGIAVCVGLPLLHQNALFNVAAMLVDKKLAGFVAKRHLAGDGIHYEPRWFRPWPDGVFTTTEIAGQAVPLGDLYFDVGGVKVGFEICEDAWVARRPGSALSLKGVDVILNPSASHFAFAKQDIRKRFVLEGSRAFGVSYVYANLLGNESGRAIYDGGALIAAGGKLVADGPRLSFEEWLLTTAVVDVEATRTAQSRTASYMPAIETDPKDRVVVPFAYPALTPVAQSARPDNWDQGPHTKEEEFARAEALALFDYLRKSRLQGFVVSLSGGADSSAVCCLIGLAVRMAALELGLERLKQRLAYIPAVKGAKSVEDVSRIILTTAYQATRNSSAATRESARAVAAAMNAEFYELEIDPLVDGYVDMVSKALGRKLDWEHDDLALQNIQARVRSPGIWMVANVKNKLLVATSNRSEAAAGYATMDGDTSGGISPIAGIDKAYLRRFLRWLETTGPLGVGPVPALSAVNRLSPGPELRPIAAAQTAEKDLMPLDVLDAVERAAIRDKLMPLESFLRLRVDFPQHDQKTLAGWVARFYRLFCRNQWKRERYAPSFHLDDENLDPKTWCRFPILNGGFEKELAELEAYVAG